METVKLIRGDKTKMGGFSGKITNAVNGEPISGATLKLREGWNNSTEGEILHTLTTDADGNFLYDTREVFGITFGLKSGNYTLSVSKSGFTDSSINIIVLPNIVNGGQNAAISPIMSEGNYRIILRWGNDMPSDLDSHYIAKTKDGSIEHVYYANDYESSANLDWDDTYYEGPETITVTDFSNLENGFTYSVHNYSNRSDNNSDVLSRSGAYVTLCIGTTEIKKYYVPTDRIGTVWNVFSIDANGRITDLNTFENVYAPSSVGSQFY